MKNQNTNWMNGLKTSLLIAVTFVTFQANAGTSNLIKTEREDFNALIQEGLDSQKELRKELRQNAGMTKTERNWDADIKETGRVVMGTLEGEQRVSPTTNFVRQKPIRPSTQDLNQERMADEFNSLDH